MKIYFLIYLFVEIVLSVEIASQLGGLITFLEVIVTAIIGFFIFRSGGFIVLSNLSRVARGNSDLNSFEKDTLFPFLGAILLIIPGFLTDIIGILLQFGFIKNSLKEKLLPKKDDFTIDMK
jgi:UPF0716 family protein affecting phage T7 exclusion